MAQGKTTAIELQDRASANINRIVGNFNKLISTAGQVDKSVKQAGSSLNRNDLTNAFNDATRSASRLPKPIDQARQSQDRLNESVNNTNRSSKGLLGTLGKMAGAIGAGVLAKKFLGKGWDRLTAIDDAQAKLSALRYEVAEIEMISANALDAVKGTSFGFDEAITASASALASGVQQGQELENYLTTIGNVASIAGSSFTDMGAIFNKVMANGKIQAEELNQLADRGVPVIAALAEHLSIAQDEVRGLAAESAITGDMFVDAMNRAYQGAARTIGSKSLTAGLKNIGASISRIAQGFLDGAGTGKGMFSQLKPLMQEFLDWLVKLEPMASRIGEVVGRIFTRAVYAVRVLISVLKPLFSILRNIFNFVANNWSIILAIRIGIAAVMDLLWLRTLDFSRAIGIARVALKLFNGEMKVFAVIAAMNPAMLIAIGLVAVVTLLYAGVAAWNKFTGASVSATGIILGALYAIGAVIANVVIFALNRLIQTIELTMNVFITLWNVVQFGAWAVLFAFAALGVGIISIVSGAVNIAGQMFFDFYNAIAEGWYEFVQGVGPLLVTMLGWIDAFVVAAGQGFYDLMFNAQTAWYEIGKGAEQMAVAAASAVDGMVNAVIGALEGMINSAISGINKMIDGVNSIPGVNVSTIGEVELTRSNFAGSVAGAFSSLAAPTRKTMESPNLSGNLQSAIDNMQKPIPKEWTDVTWGQDARGWLSGLDTPTATPFIQGGRMDYLGVKNAAQTGYEHGKNLLSNSKDWLDRLTGQNELTENTNKLLDGLQEDLSGMGGTPGELGGGSGGGGGGNPTGGKLDSVGEIEDELTIDDEFLKLVKDVAHQRWQQNFITMTPEIVTNIGTINDVREQENFIRVFNRDISDAIYNAVDGIT